MWTVQLDPGLCHNTLSMSNQVIQRVYNDSGQVPYKHYDTIVSLSTILASPKPPIKILNESRPIPLVGLNTLQVAFHDWLVNDHILVKSPNGFNHHVKFLTLLGHFHQTFWFCPQCLPWEKGRRGARKQRPCTRVWIVFISLARFSYVSGTFLLSSLLASEQHACMLFHSKKMADFAHSEPDFTS